MTDFVNVLYRIKLDDNTTEDFNFKLDDETFDLADSGPAEPPAWTELGFQQCSHCPLSTEEHSHCPLALQMFNVVDRFHNTRSIDEVDVEVVTEERTVTQRTALQRVIASMLDLVYPACGCPKTAYMKPLARFHLPLCSEEETVFRVTGMYLLGQYFLQKTASRGRIEFDGLSEIYNDLHILNTSIARRLQNATLSDSTKNAVTLMDMYSTLVPLLLEDELVEMRGFFNAFLPEDEEPQEKTTSNYLEKAKAFSMDLELMPVENEKPDDDLPDWLKQVKDGEIEQETSDAKEEKKEPVDNSPFTTSDGLTLELAPIDGEQEEKPAGSSGKANFSLPDD